MASNESLHETIDQKTDSLLPGSLNEHPSQCTFVAIQRLSPWVIGILEKNIDTTSSNVSYKVIQKGNILLKI